MGSVALVGLPTFMSIGPGQVVALHVLVGHAQREIVRESVLDAEAGLLHFRVLEVRIEDEDGRLRQGRRRWECDVNDVRVCRDLSVPVKVIVCTLMPLFECAVPIMIDGVRP